MTTKSKPAPPTISATSSAGILTKVPSTGRSDERSSSRNMVMGCGSPSMCAPGPADPAPDCSACEQLVRDAQSDTRRRASARGTCPDRFSWPGRLLGHVAAVHAEDRAGDPVGLRCGQERDRRGDVGRRYELALSDRSREIAILAQAFHLASPFELYAHRQAGRVAGLSDAEIEGLAARPEPGFRDDEERAVFPATLPILDRGTLDDAEYEAAVAALG